MSFLKYTRRLLCGIMILSIVLTYGFSAEAAVIKGKTGTGMAEWALRAYNEGWKYVYGGSTEGKIDCSGLIRSYCNGRGGGAKALLDASSESGNIKSIPRVHGLGLWCEGHAGVYVGKSEDGTDMVVDARNSRVNVVYSELNSRYWSPWVKWFKIGMISYPTTGWYEFNGSTYYYHNGEFVVGTFTVDGIKYDFGKSGALKGKASETTTTTTATTTTTTTITTTTTTTVTSTTEKSTKTTTASSKTTTTKASSNTTSATVSTKESKTSSSKTTGTTAKSTTKTTKTTTSTTASAIQKYKALRLGDRSDDVLSLQNRLSELGYFGASPSGYFGSQTEAAVRLFQKAASLSVDGVAGNETQTVLYSDDAPRYGTTTTTVTSTTAVSTTASTTTDVSETEQSETEPDETKPTEVSASDITEDQQPDWESLYTDLDMGSTGDTVIELQDKLKGEGFYEQPLTNYYGSFTRDAVRAFQLSVGLEATGTADAYTQYLLYNGLTAGDSQREEQFSAEYYEFGGDLYDSLGIEASGVMIEKSEGLTGYSIKASPELFVSVYGNKGGLSTLGAFSQSKPVTVIYKNGTAYELDSDTLEELENSIFN